MSTRAVKAAKKPKAQPPCKCLEQVNESLADQGINTRVAVTVHMNFKTRQASMLPRLGVERAGNDRKSLKTIVPSYCPFCGKKYPHSKG